MMRHLFSISIPSLVMILSVVSLVGILKFRAWRWARETRQSPLTQNMLRPPGYSLVLRLTDLNEKLLGDALTLILFPLLIFATHISQSYFAGHPESLERVIPSVMGGLLLLAFAGRRLWMILGQRRNCLLGLEGESFVGEELNQLMLAGCRVFHDIEFPYGNIDHVVVSSSGVSAVNTKMLGKAKDGDRNRANLVVDYKENLLIFSDRNVPIPTEQLLTESRWLAEHLSSATGRSIQVEPMLALPGWNIIERRGKGEVFVLNPRNAERFFVRQRTVLSSEEIQQVTHQLEQLCRTVESKYRESKKWSHRA